MDSSLGISSSPAVSVLLPVRNGGRFLSRAIESVLSDPYEDFELIVVDDGSQDDTASVARLWEQRDVRVRLHREAPAVGLVGALQIATRMARGGYLARMDADDLWRLRLHAQIQLMESDPRIAVVSGLVEIVGNPRDAKGEPDGGFARYQEWINGLVEPEAIARERFIESPVVHPTVLMRRRAFDAVGGYRDAPWAEDYDLWLRLMDAGWKIAKVPEVVLEWQDGSDRLTRRDRRYASTNMMQAKAHYLAKLEQVRRNGVMISGAGPTGKMLCRYLKSERIAVHAFLEVHPRRVGGRIGEVAVLEARGMPPAGEGAPVQIGAVAQPGRRDVVRLLMRERGYIEGIDFFNCA